MKYLPDDQLYLIQGCLYVGIKSHASKAKRSEYPDVQPGKLYDVLEIDDHKFEAYCINDKLASCCSPSSVDPIGLTIWESEQIRPVHSTPIDKA